MLEGIHQRVQPIITEANKIFIAGFRGDSEIRWKEGVQLSTSAVTDTDDTLDPFFRERLGATFPGMGMITEEDEAGSQQEYTWIVDPTDGSANHGNKIPITGISLALWRGDEPVYGLLSFPLEDEIVHAVTGHGLFYNGERVTSQKLKVTPHLSTLFTGVGTNEEKLAAVARMSRVVPFPNNFQSAAFHFKTLALRRADCGVFLNLPIWDIAAGILITKEAGLFNVVTEASVKSTNLRENRYTVVVGQEDIATKVAEELFR